MKIKSIEPIAVSLPMKKPVTMAGETVARADNVLVRIEAEDGFVGWGEAASAPTMTGETTASMLAAMAHMAPASHCVPPAILRPHRRRWTRMYGNSGAKAAIDIALYDVVGRATGQPVYAAFGTKRRSRLPILAVIGSTDQAADLHEADARWASGFRAFKIKVGLDGPEADAARTAAICRALKRRGEECLVSADANQGFNVEKAIRYVTALGDCGLDFFEQPVKGHDLDGMARVAAAGRVPIGADEGIHGLDDIERHHARKAAAARA